MAIALEQQATAILAEYRQATAALQFESVPEDLAEPGAWQHIVLYNTTAEGSKWTAASEQFPQTKAILQASLGLDGVPPTGTDTDDRC